ncbi:MAG TPA: zinc-binding dehydrogenase [Candidatus Obscuribacterales bacterium]
MQDAVNSTEDTTRPASTQEAWAMQIPRKGGYDVFEKVAVPRKPPGPDEVAIDVKACGVNFADTLMRMGMYPEAPKMPFVPGYEVAGTVAAVGADVKNLKPGDRVMSATYFGGYTTYAVVQQDKALPIPEHLDFEQAAGLLVNFMTAWVALHEMSRIRTGDHVLIHGVAGGVGLAALQIAKNAGCVVYGTAGSQEKLDYAKSKGLDYGVNYRKHDFVEDIRLNVGRRPIDTILDAVGGDNIAKDRKLLKPSGRVVIYGMASAVTGEKANPFASLLAGLQMFHVNILSLFSQNQGIYGLNVLRLWPHDIMRRCGEEILKEFNEKRLETTIDKVFALEDVGEAHRYLQDRKNIGNVVLRVNS